MFTCTHVRTSRLNCSVVVMGSIVAWNDNGKAELIHSPDAFYRSDFFGGLGWMLTNSTWQEVQPPISFRL
jgi:hypothetical protein